MSATALAPDATTTAIDVCWKNDEIVVVLAGAATPRTCHDLQARLRGRVAAGAEVVIELPGAQQLGLPSLAALVQLARSVRSVGGRLHLVAGRHVADEVADRGLWRVLPVRVPARLSP